MKKYIIALILCILLVGCKTKNSLTCKSEEEVSGNTYKTEIKFKYDDKKVSKAKLTMTVLLNDNVKFYDIYYNAFEQTFDDLKDKDGIEVEVKKIDNGYKAIIDVDYNIYKGQVEMINSSLTKDQTKIYYENIKYECK